MSHLATSDRLVLRRLSRNDLKPFQAYRQDPDVARYQSWASMTDNEAIGFLTAMETEPLMAPGEWSQIAIAKAETNTLIGDMGLFLSADQTEAEIGITLASDYHGQGFAMQAMRLAFDLIWQNSPAQAIRAWGDQRNTASVALMRRVGMSHLGTEQNDDVTEEAFILHRPQVR